MLDFYAEGGWTLFPTTLFGILAMGAAAIIAFRPERRFVPLLVALSAVTLCSAFLGSAIGLWGVVKASANAAPADVSAIVSACAVQALSSVLVAFACLTLASLGTALGAVRHAMNARAA
ncbi:MAG: hypothetical protein U0228_17385 [Myxococcaceae bacterium]